jgi:3-hydroxyisobutyrate dehydrogenase-like beta-hydroxyacid dehydrogenase
MAILDGWKIGFIGLGLMGKPMARNLLRAGALLSIYNRSTEVLAELSAEGMQPAEAACEVAARSDITLIMVTNTPSVDAVLSGDDGVLAGTGAGKLVIDMGTTAVQTTREFAERTNNTGAEWIDAPVSGGQIGAEKASLTVMVGADRAAYARALPLFEQLGDRVTHVGDVGAGQVAKAANQVIVGLTIAAVAEGLALAKHAGVEPAKVRQALEGGFAASRILELHGERMVEGNFVPGGKASVQLKDIVQGLDLAAQSGLRLPSLERNRELYDQLVEAGWGGLDHSALYKLYESD